MPIHKNTIPESALDDAALEDKLTTPSQKDVEVAAQLTGDVLVLGAAGKMGPSLVARIGRAMQVAGVQHKVIAVVRKDRGDFRSLPPDRVQVVEADLLDAQAFANLPDAPNVIFMIGRKFGSMGDLPLTLGNQCLVSRGCSEPVQALKHSGVFHGQCLSLRLHRHAGSQRTYDNSTSRGIRSVGSRQRTVIRVLLQRAPHPDGSSAPQLRHRSSLRRTARYLREGSCRQADRSGHRFCQRYLARRCQLLLFSLVATLPVAGQNPQRHRHAQAIGSRGGAEVRSPFRQATQLCRNRIGHRSTQRCNAVYATTGRDRHRRKSVDRHDGSMGQLRGCNPRQTH